MSKTQVQDRGEVWLYSGSLASSGSLSSGSFASAGYARVVGIVTLSASTRSDLGLQIWQSPDHGLTYDYFTEFDISACSGSAFSVEIVGNSVDIRLGVDSEADEIRMCWYARPI